MRIGIVGWGLEGQSALRYFGPEHQYLIANEHPRDDFPSGSQTIKVQYLQKQRQPGLTGNVEDLSYLEEIEDCDKIVYSNTSYKNLRKFFGDSGDFWGKAQTVQHIFFENCKSKNLIGVTGSKGKGTTSTLIAEMLKAEGKKVHLGGNIGISVLDLLPKVEAEDWVVLELSNFQLMDFPYSPHVAVCLMITEEHLDWHPDMTEYLEAKSNIFKHQSTDDIAIYFANDDNSKKLAEYSKGVKVPYLAKPGAFVRNDGMIVVGEGEAEIIATKEVKLLGEHNLQNICAAVTTVFEALGSIDKAKSVLSSFAGLEHRLELVRSLEGIKYYDDSFATTPEATIVAIKAFKEPKVMVLGGHDKGLNTDKLVEEVVKNNTRHAILIGDTAPMLGKLLREKGYNKITSGLTDMESVVRTAREKALEGDVVLLSTGFASFGMFKDYKDRGEQFKKAALALS